MTTTTPTPTPSAWTPKTSSRRRTGPTPPQENTPSARPAGEPATAFRLDQLFNYGGTVEYQDGELDLPGEPASCDTGTTPTGTCGPDPLLAEFQATDPATGKPYADDFGWLSHTFDTPYLDVGCATQDYIEAELNENTTDVTAAPGTTPGTGGLGLPEQTIATGATDVTNPLGTYNPQVFVPGNHSGFADLDPGTPATVDPPDLDLADTSATGGSLASGTYEYAVTDQFNGADSTSYRPVPGLCDRRSPGRCRPGGGDRPDRVGLACLAGHLPRRQLHHLPFGRPLHELDRDRHLRHARLGHPARRQLGRLHPGLAQHRVPGQRTTGSPDPTSCAGEQELTFTDTGATSGTPAGASPIWTCPCLRAGRRP